MRRIFLIMSILYFLRSITMYVTVLPVSSTTYYCSPKSNSTAILIIAKRSFQLMSGFGLSINGKHTYCGDYIYSGHTVMLVLGYMVLSECESCASLETAHRVDTNSHFADSPRRISYLHWIPWLIAAVGVFMVLLAHGHYTIDILIAYYITTRLFWTYHTLTNNAFLIKVSSARSRPASLIDFSHFSSDSIRVRIIICRANGGSGSTNTSSRTCAARYRMNSSGRCRGREDFKRNSRTAKVNTEPVFMCEDRKLPRQTQS